MPVSRIRGYDRSYRLRTRQTVRVFESVTAADLASQLCGPVGVQVSATAGEGPRFARVVQHRQSDFDLLVEVAARAGRLVAAAGDTVTLSTLDGEGDDIPLRYGANLHEVTVEEMHRSIEKESGVKILHHERQLLGEPERVLSEKFDQPELVVG